MILGFSVINILSRIPSIRRKPSSFSLVTVAASSFLVFGRHRFQILAKTANSQYNVHRDISQSLQQIVELTIQSRHSFFYILSKSPCINHPNILNTFMDSVKLFVM